jgi:hypothetical protein
LTDVGIMVVVVDTIPRVGTGSDRPKGLRCHKAVERDWAEMMSHQQDSSCAKKSLGSGGAAGDRR